MKISLICKPQTDLSSKKNIRKLNHLGYEVERFWSEDISLSNFREEESSQFCNKIEFQPHVESLRNNWKNMLIENEAADDLLIFGEEDVVPRIKASILNEKMKKIIDDAYVDVYRLFFSLERNHCLMDDFLFTDFSFSFFLDKDSWRESPYVYGTHALIVPRKSRRKLAQVFNTYKLPTDTALEMATSKGEIVMKVANANLFYQEI